MRSVIKNNKLMTVCPNFHNVKCDCKEYECKFLTWGIKGKKKNKNKRAAGTKSARA